MNHARKKILFLTSRFPWPLDKGDKLRAYYFIKEISKHHDIYLFSLSSKKLSPSDIQQLAQYCKDIKIFYLSPLRILINLIYHLLFSYKPLQVGYFYHFGVNKSLKKYTDHVEPDLIFCQLIRMAEYVKNLKHVKILDYMDALSKGMERRYWNAHPAIKWAFKIETKRLKIYEHNIFSFFHFHTIISDTDRKCIMHALNDNITIVPNGVDTQKFARKIPPDPYTIIFPGNLSYPPNIDAAIRLATKIFPAISKEIPGSRLILCGSSPALPVKKLACENIIVTGWVENIVEYYEKASLMIAPLRLGSGMQNKILESMAMQVPCITTPMVNLSIGAKENEEILLAQTDEDFVQKAILLLKNESLRQKIAQNGYDLVKNQYNWQTKLEKLINIIEHGRS